MKKIKYGLLLVMKSLALGLVNILFCVSVIVAVPLIVIRGAWKITGEMMEVIDYVYEWSKRK